MLTGIIKWHIGWLVGSMLSIVDGMPLGVELGGVVGINEGSANGTKITGFGNRDETSLGCKDDDGFVVGSMLGIVDGMSLDVELW